LKALDGDPRRALPAYRRALTGPTRDDSGAVRYWAALGLHTRAFTQPFPSKNEEDRELFRALLADPSPAVRVVAAHALCDCGEVDKALPALLRACKEPLESARLLAAAVFDQLGDQARPVLPQLEALPKGGYPARMLKHIRRRFNR